MSLKQYSFISLPGFSKNFEHNPPRCTWQSLLHMEEGIAKWITALVFLGLTRAIRQICKSKTSNGLISPFLAESYKELPVIYYLLAMFESVSPDHAMDFPAPTFLPFRFLANSSEENTAYFFERHGVEEGLETIAFKVQFFCSVLHSWQTAWSGRGKHVIACRTVTELE